MYEKEFIGNVKKLLNDIHKENLNAEPIKKILEDFQDENAEKLELNKF